MLTKRELETLEAAHAISDSHVAVDRKLLEAVIADLKAQRVVVFMALKCTGEDGYDGINDLSVAAEEYLEALGDADPRWRTHSVYQNIRRIEAE